MRPVLLLAMVLFSTPVWAEDWKTTDGMVYVNVRIIEVQDDAVTILYKDGGALVPLQKLPPALQEKFNYDPVKAKIAADARIKADALNAKELQAEIDRTAKQKREQQIKDAKALGEASPPAK